MGISDVFYSQPDYPDSTVLSLNMSICGNVSTIAGGNVTLECTEKLTGRYIYVYLKAGLNNSVAFSELQVYGTINREYLIKWDNAVSVSLLGSKPTIHVCTVPTNHVING